MVILIRVDATVSMGMGHFMRCLAFAQWCRAHEITPIFVLCQIVGSMADRIAKEGFESYSLSCMAGSLDDAKQTLSVAKQLKATHILFDGYHFDTEYFAVFESQDKKLIFIDDFGKIPPFAHTVVNFQPWANSNDYADNCKQFLGLEYFLLRKEFWPYFSQEKLNNDKKNMLIMLGGTDPHQFTQTLITMLGKLDIEPMHLSVVLGQPHHVTIPDQYPHQIKIYIDVQDMSTIESTVDLAITGSGGSCWELAFMKVPCLTVIQADNQIAVAHAMQERGFGLNLGWYYEINDKALASNIHRILSTTETLSPSLNIARRTDAIFSYLRDTL